MGFFLPLILEAANNMIAREELTFTGKIFFSLMETAKNENGIWARNFLC